MKDWTSPTYAFFDPTPTIETKGDQCAHSFKCMVKGCQGDEVLQAADEVRNAEGAHMKIVGNFLQNGSIMTVFERKGQGKVTYSHRQHTWTETKAEIVRWISENLQPFGIVKDRGFQSLMKTGRPEYYIPSPSTVSRDARLIFAKQGNE
ncbi:hypothetical protein BDR03DRAFT_933525 [Suillus americanus]|nr:hypothetical protein BDR03DRAFT_933525 [Suillus americanus]